MLSFDFTDRLIRIVKGTQNGGKIMISETIVIDLPQGLIINGFIQSPQQLSTIILKNLHDKSFNSKEAVACISSSQIIFREVIVNKAKPSHMPGIVKAQVQKDIAIDDSYSVGYSIVSEQKQSKELTLKVLAFASPNELSLGYKKLFYSMGITLKSISAATNCISRVILSDARNKQKMPLLTVEINRNYLNLTLFENGHLSLAKYITIEQNQLFDDNIFLKILSDNVFRIIQFVKTRGGQSVKDVVIYGDVSNYFVLARTLEQQELRTSVLVVPPNINGYERVEFTLFANAIGALYKTKKDIEKINLLEAENISDSLKKSETISRGIPKNILVTGIFTVIFISAVYIYFISRSDFVKKDSTEIQSVINSEVMQNKICEYNDVLKEKTDCDKYFTDIVKANDALVSRRCVTSKIINKIQLIGTSLGTSMKFAYSENIISIECVGRSQEIASDFVKKLDDTQMFEHVSYSGYKNEGNGYKFTIKLLTKAGEQ